jgi:hypothetical protein
MAKKTDDIKINEIVDVKEDEKKVDESIITTYDPFPEDLK